MADPNKRCLQGADMIHMTFVTPMGELSRLETPVSLDDLCDYIAARINASKVAVSSQDEEGSL